jgi:preprotein translocase subunit SecA
LNEYKREAFELFEEMLSQMRDEVTMHLARVELPSEEQIVAAMTKKTEDVREGREDPAMAGAGGAASSEGEGRTQPLISRKAAAEIDPDDPSSWGKVPRNAACPCGSGKKFKHCHGKPV